MRYQVDEENIFTKLFFLSLPQAILKRAEKEKSPKRHRQSKPFDTIEEEKEKLPRKHMESKAVQVSRGFNEILTRIKPLSRVSSASSSESVSSAGRTRTRQSSHKSTSRTSSDSKPVRDSSKCIRHNGHTSTTEGHLRSSHGSRSSRQTNSSSHENSIEDIRAVVVAPRRSRRSNGTDGMTNERLVVEMVRNKSTIRWILNFIRRDSQRKSERKHDHHRTSSSSRLVSGDKVSATRSSHRTKEVSAKEKGELVMDLSVKRFVHTKLKIFFRSQSNRQTMKPTKSLTSPV